MYKLDKFGQGRSGVIDEMIEFCDKEIGKIKNHGYDPDTHIRATMTGQMKGFIKVKQRLAKKKIRLLLQYTEVVEND